MEANELQYVAVIINLKELIHINKIDIGVLSKPIFIDMIKGVERHVICILDSDTCVVKSRVIVSDKKDFIIYRIVDINIGVEVALKEDILDLIKRTNSIKHVEQKTLFNEK